MYVCMYVGTCKLGIRPALLMILMAFASSRFLMMLVALAATRLPRRTGTTSLQGNTPCLFWTPLNANIFSFEIAVAGFRLRHRHRRLCIQFATRHFCPIFSSGVKAHLLDLQISTSSRTGHGCRPRNACPG